ncbi:doublesex- and mab-3-related transcription factor B1-like isoform X2 [Acanthopagrus latus]|uniref:doublesex- and mab-3-related transcription factor B1-like isoform X2 n=1 Tax=Acanthopagrus latus TaxID=8177 RepID=UPI00187C5736|nr:doublesex- and mab-3-related transcription factor B1-like isoform X2 [Acanthopagrus latus]
MSSSSKSCQPTRQPTCTRCRHHGIIVQRKGHMKFCPYLKCGCWRCFLITQRTRITALHRSQGGDRLPPQDTERQPCAQTGEVRPAVEGTVSGSAPDGGAPQSATPQLLISQPSGGAAAAAAAAAGAPPDLRGRPAAVDGGLAASASTEERSDAPNVARFGPTAPLPVIHFPFHWPSSFASCPDLMFNIPRAPAVPAGLYNNPLCGPQMFPHFQSGPLNYLPLPWPGPPADGRQMFFMLQPPPPPPAEPYQEELMDPQPPPSSEEVIELD